MCSDTDLTSVELVDWPQLPEGSGSNTYSEEDWSTMQSDASVDESGGA